MAITLQPASAATCRIISPSGPPPMMATVSPGCGRESSKTVHSAGQRLGQRGVFQRHMIGNMKRVLRYDARGNADELSVRSIVEEQVVAEILLPAFAKVAVTARRGVEGDYAVARHKPTSSSARFHNRSGKLVAKQRGRHDQARMIAATKDLQVRAAGQRRAHADDQLAWRRLRHGNPARSVHPRVRGGSRPSWLLPSSPPTLPRANDRFNHDLH